MPPHSQGSSSAAGVSLPLEDSSSTASSSAATANAPVVETTTTTPQRAAKRIRVFDESDITDSDRRNLRQKQRLRREEIDQATTLDDLKQQRRNNNVLFSDVRYPREAVLDSENVELIAQKFVKCSESLVQVPRYDPLKILRRLKQGLGVADWRTLGIESTICYNAVPMSNFLAGPLDAIVPEREERQRQRRRPHENDNAGEVQEMIGEDHQEGNEDNLAEAENTRKALRNRLRQRQREGDQQAVNGVQFLVNPQSFTQTVENIFHLSFLIKKGESKVTISDSLNLEPISRQEMQLQPRPTQAICRFTMRDWKRWSENVEQGDMPHRATHQQRKHEST